MWDGRRKCFDPVAPECRDAYRRFPVTEWDFGLQPVAALTPAGQRIRVGPDPCLIREDKPPNVDEPVPVFQRRRL